MYKVPGIYLVHNSSTIAVQACVEDRIRRYRPSPRKHANHEDTLTNVRSMRSAINDGPSRMVHVRQYSPNLPGSRGSSTRPTLTPTFHIEDSLREIAREFCGGASLSHIKKKAARQGLGQTGPRPRQGRHHRRGRPPYWRRQ